MRLDEFQGVNAGYVLELYERFRQNPDSVDPATRRAFESWTPLSADVGTPAAIGVTSVEKIVGAANLADCIRRYGHLAAHIDPLDSEPIGDPSLSPAAHGITDDDLATLKSRYTDDERFEIVVAASLGSALERLRAGLRALEEA